MRHVYHVPEPGNAAADGSGSRQALTRAVEAAVLRGVARGVAGLVGDGPEPAGRVIPLIRPPASGRGSDDTTAEDDTAAGQAGRRRHIAVPSYQDKGRPVAVPVAPAAGGGPSSAGPSAPGQATPAPAPHPTVKAVNDLAELVRRAEQAPPAPPAVTPPPGAGLLGRMWARGSSQDTARLLRPTPTRDDLQRSEALLIRTVSQEARRIATVLLDRNEVVVRREGSRYGETAPGPDKPAVRLRAAAGEMAGLQRQILDRVREVGNAQAAGVPGAPQAGRPLDASHFDDVLEGSIARGDPKVQRELLPRFLTLKRIYGPEFPILLGRNLDLSAFAVADPAQLARAVGSTTSDVLQSIGKLRDRLTDESVWQLGPVLEAARHLLGVLPGTPAAAALDRYLAERARDEFLRQLLVTALGITLAIAATVATAGAAAPAAGAGAAALAGGLSLAAAGVSVLGAVEHYESYTFERSAAHSSLDPATALAHEDPSLAWLAVSVLGAVLDVGTAVMAVRNLAKLAKLAVATKDLVALEQAARAQAKVLIAEGRLAGTEQEFVDAVLKSARQQVGGAAAGASAVLQYGKTVFRLNPGGPRTLAEAVALARSHNVEIGADVLIRVDASLGTRDFARYGNDAVLRAGDRVSWNSLIDEVRPPRPGIRPTYWTEHPVEEADSFIRIRLRPEVLNSDEAIVAVLAHEMHEINYLRKELAGGKTLSEAAFKGLVNADSGTLHLEAWRKAIELVEKMRLP